VLEALLALRVQPGEPAADGEPGRSADLVGEEIVDVSGNAGLRGAPRPLVRGDDDVGEHRHGGELVRGEEERLRGRQLHGGLGGARARDGAYRGREGGEGEESERLAPVHVAHRTPFFR
jgi:hypothetical protein